MPYEFYKVMHLVGVMLTFLSLGGLIFRGLIDREETSLRKFGGICSGLGLILVLVGGFGLLARLGLEITQGWILMKIGIWLLFGAAISLANRLPEVGKTLWFVLVVLGGTAAFLGGSKPF